MTLTTSPLRKNRYITIAHPNDPVITKIKDATLVMVKAITFNVFNIPVPCIEIDNIGAIIHLNSMVILSLWDHTEEELLNIRVFVHENKLYTPLSELKFPQDADKQNFAQLKKARGL